MTAKDKLQGFTTAMIAKGYKVERTIVWGRPGSSFRPCSARIEYRGPAGEFFGLAINESGEVADMSSPMSDRDVADRQTWNRLDNTTTDAARRAVFGL